MLYLPCKLGKIGEIAVENGLMPGNFPWPHSSHVHSIPVGTHTHMVLPSYVDHMLHMLNKVIHGYNRVGGEPGALIINIENTASICR